MENSYQSSSTAGGQYITNSSGLNLKEEQFQPLLGEGVHNSNLLTNFQYEDLNNIAATLAQRDESASVLLTDSSFDVTSQSEKSEKTSKSDRKESSVDKKEDTNSRSVFINNVEYKAAPEELKEHFKICGEILRVTIICNKKTGKSMGHAYIEFETEQSADKAIELFNDSLFKGRQIKVIKKRMNVPGKKRHAKKHSKGHYGYPSPRGMGAMIPFPYAMHMPYMPYPPMRGMMPRGRGKW